MKKAIIAALLSLFVFPGTGHVYLKKMKTGFAIMAASLLSLVFLVMEIFRIVWQILEQINQGYLSADMDQLTAMVRHDISYSQGHLLNGALIMLLLCWLGSVIDAFRIGWQQGHHQDLQK